MANPQSYPLFAALDDNGYLLTGGLLYSYVVGTSTAKITYANKACTVANTWPVTLDARGEAQVYLNGQTDLILKDALGNVIWGPVTCGSAAGSSSGDVFYYGAVGDGVTDDTAAIQAALDGTHDGGVVLLGDGSYTFKITSTLTWDVSRVTIRGQGAVIDASNVAGIALQAYNGTGSYAYFKYNKNWSEGFELYGSRSTNPSGVGLELGGTENTANFNLRNVVINGFNIGLHINPPSWLQNWFDCLFSNLSIYDCDYAIKAVNGGERVYFDYCTIHDNVYGFTVDQGDWTLHNCNLDYNVNYIISAVNAARVDVLNGHLEGRTDNDYWVKCSGGSSRVSLVGTSITNTCASPKTYELFLADQCGAEGVFLEGLQLGSGFTAGAYGPTNLVAVTDYTGRVVCRQPFTTMTPNSAYNTGALMISEWLSYLTDGGFETGYTVDWTVSSGAGIDAPSLDASEKHGGTQSLKFNPGAGNYSRITRAIPCQVGEWGRMSFWVKNSFGASADEFQINAGYLAADGSEVASYTQATTLSLAGTSYSDWTQLWITPLLQAPPGAVSIFFQFTTSISDGGAASWIDDIQINMWTN